MRDFFYELHHYEDPSFPIIFHFHQLPQQFNEIFYHWHINIELLYFISGEAEVSSNSNTYRAGPGDIIIINSNHLHNIKTISDNCSYYCLILDYRFCMELDFDVTSSVFCEKTRDPEMVNIFNIIIREMTNKKDHYKKAVRALCVTMSILLYRNQVILEAGTGSKADPKVEMIKSSIEYMNKNYRNNFNLDELASEICVSKYHFCRIFKELTGKTIKEYILMLRCHNAQLLLQKNNISILECAERSGFNDASYFSRCYKKQFGYLPSQERKKIQESN